MKNIMLIILLVLALMTWLKLANNGRIREEKMLRGDKE